MGLADRFRAADDDRLARLHARKQKTPEWDGDTPVLDFIINALWYGIPTLIVVVIFLAALRILGWF